MKVKERYFQILKIVFEFRIFHKQGFKQHSEACSLGWKKSDTRWKQSYIPHGREKTGAVKWGKVHRGSLCSLEYVLSLTTLERRDENIEKVYDVILKQR